MHSKKPERRAEVSQIFRKSRAKELQISKNFGAPRAEKLPEIGQRALRELKHVAAALERVGSAFQCETVRVRRRCHANFPPNLRVEIPKFPEIRRAARAKTACIRPASAAHTQRNVAEVDRVDVAYHFKKARVWRRNHANVAPKSRVKIAKFLKIFGAPRAQKIACTRPACAATRITSSKLFTKS